MSTKFCFFLIVLIASFTCHVKGRLVGRDADESIDSNRNKRDLSTMKDLSDQEIEQLKQHLSKELTPVQVNVLGELLKKFKKGSTSEDHIDGMIGLLALTEAVKRNITDADTAEVFREDESDDPDSVVFPNYIG